MGRKSKQQIDEEERLAEREERIGDNKPELTEDEQRALLYQHKRDYVTAKQKVDDAKAELLRVCKLAKSECGKSAVIDIKELIALEEPHGGEALKADIERRLKLARWANASVGTQFRFDDMDRTPDVDRARELGKTAGLKGEPKKPPFDHSVPQHDAWCDGWHDGQAVLMSNFRTKLKPLDDVPADAEQMDLSERTDLPPATDFTPPDVSDPPFAPPPEPGFTTAEPTDDLDVRTVANGVLNRTTEAA